MARTIAAIFAHPDDETFATGGTLAKYASEGARIVLYCATDGGAGKSSGIPVSSGEELARLRRTELANACAVLGIEPPVFGGHADGALGAADRAVIVGEVMSFLDDAEPDVAITFGPEGAPTQHRDHRAISALATEACSIVGVRRLCYVTWLPPQPGDRYQTMGSPVDITVDVRAWLPKKRDSFLAHASQQQHQVIFNEVAMMPVECYHVVLGAPAPAGAADLFAGL